MSTPTGSTAAGFRRGPLVYPELQAFCLTPVCPFLSNFSPMVLPVDQPLVVEVQEPRGEVRLTVDGQRTFALEYGDEVFISRSPNDLLMAQTEKVSYFAKLSNRAFQREVAMHSHEKLFDSACDIMYGKDPELDALLLHFITENNLEHTIDPVKNASPEQIRFIVSLGEDNFYAPCGDWMLHFLLKGRLSPDLKNEYADQWRLLVNTVRGALPQGPLRKRIIALCRHKFRLTLNAPILIP